jgi:hypothetical protein
VVGRAPPAASMWGTDASCRQNFPSLARSITARATDHLMTMAAASPGRLPAPQVLSGEGSFQYRETDQMFTGQEDS